MRTLWFYGSGTPIYLKFEFTFMNADLINAQKSSLDNRDREHSEFYL